MPGSEHSSTPCPPEGELIAALRGELGQAARERIDEHLAACDSCAELIAELVRMGWHDALPVADGSDTDDPEATRPRTTSGLPLEGRVGRYLLLELVGRGAMGAVWSAYDPALDRKVAIKLVPVGPSPTVTQAEARLLARVSHPHVVQVFDAGLTATHLYLVMELVHGATLRQWLSVPRERAEVIEVFTEVARGLAAVHDAGLVHRDFKPDNVLIASRGAKVVDFGLAGLLAGATTQSIMRGTPAYMAPEQHAGLAIGAACDQFAFCVALVEALTGERPFAAATSAELVAAKLRGPDVALPAGDPLRAIVQRGLAPDPAARFADMPALVAAMQRAIAPRRRRLVGIAAAVTLLAIVPASATGAATDTPCEPPIELRELADRRITPIHDRHAETGGEAWARAESRLDAFTGSWAHVYGESCDPDAPPSLERCLAAQLRHTDAMLEVLAGPDVRSVDAALRVLARVPDPQACRRDEPILDEDEGELTAAIERVRDELDRADVLGDAGEGERAIALAAEASARAKELGFVPLQAEAELAHGELLHGFGHYAAALPVLDDAYHHAIAADHRSVAALAAATRIVATTQLDQPAGSELWVGRARTELARGTSSVAAAEVYDALGNEASYRGDYDAAVVSFAAALASFGETHDLDHPQAAAFLANLGSAHVRRGELAEARVQLERALEISRRHLGANDEALGPMLSNLGAAVDAQGDPALARLYYGQAVAIFERTSPDTALLAMALSNRGNAERDLGHHAEAIASWERALDIMARAVGDEHPLLANIYFNIGELLVKDGERERGRAQLMHARVLWESVGALHERDIAEIEKILAR